MNLIPVKDAHEKGTLPISLATAYTWHSLKKYPGLLFKVANKLFMDKDEWDNMAIRAREKQIEESKKLRAGLNEKY